jgi:hypothetical protein
MEGKWLIFRNTGGLEFNPPGEDLPGSETSKVLKTLEVYGLGLAARIEADTPEGARYAATEE